MYIKVPKMIIKNVQVKPQGTKVLYNFGIKTNCGAYMTGIFWGKELNKQELHGPAILIDAEGWIEEYPLGSKKFLIHVIKWGSIQDDEKPSGFKTTIV